MSDLFDAFDDDKKGKKKMMRTPPGGGFVRPPPAGSNTTHSAETTTNLKPTASAFVPGGGGLGGGLGGAAASGAAPVPPQAVSSTLDEQRGDEEQKEEVEEVVSSVMQKVAKTLTIGGDSGSDSALSQMAEREQKLKEEQQRKEEKEEAKRLQQMEKERKDSERKKEAEEEEKQLMEELANSKDADSREHLNLVFIGHVDAGKSTIGGQILYLSGQVDQRVIEKYEREAKDKNRDSWYMAYIMDTSEEERAKGKTVEVGKAHFATEKKRYTVLDAPGHKNYVPNMIAGAAQADVGVLVIAARKGEFETGFEKGGQTREHAQLAKTLGVTKLVVVVNKMDDPSVKWDKKRFDEVHTKLIPFLKICGYKEKDITFVPISGLKGTNVKDLVSKSECDWYGGKSFFDTLDDLEPMDRDPNAPFRMPVMDKYAEMGCMVMGKTESGACRVGQKLTLMPGRIDCKIEKLWQDEDECSICKCGENVRMKLSGVDEKDIHPGMVLCPPNKLVHVTQEIECQLAIVELLDHKSIFSTGYNAVIHIHSVTEEIEVKKLVSEMDPKTRKPKESKCKYLKAGSIGAVRITIAAPICVEKFSDVPQLGRFTLRDEGKTIAIGKVLRIKPKSEEIDNMAKTTGGAARIKWTQNQSSRTLKTDAYVAGNGDFFRLGIPLGSSASSSSKRTFVPVDIPTNGGGNIKSIASGGAHSLVVTSKGEVFATGLNEYGQCGIRIINNADDDKGGENGESSNNNAKTTMNDIVRGWTRVEFRDATCDGNVNVEIEKAISGAGDANGDAYYSGKIKTDKDERFSLIATAIEFFFPQKSSSSSTTITATATELPQTNSFRKIPGLRNIVNCSVTDACAAFVDAHGKTFTIGTTSGKVLGREVVKGGEENTTTNALGAIEDVLLENVSLGFNFAVAVAKSSGALFTWGAALDDQEADSKYGLKPRLVKHEPQNINVAFTKVSSGYKHCAAITSDDRLFTWGWSGSVGQHFEDEESSAGQLGLGNDFDYPTPTEVKWKDRSTKVLDVRCGQNHTIVLASRED
ncbi:unnamed protein product [Bathycoccus prasinos]